MVSLPLTKPRTIGSGSVITKGSWVRCGAPVMRLGAALPKLSSFWARRARFAARKSGAATPVDTAGQIAERFMRTYIEAAGERLEDKERLQVRASVYQVVSLLRMVLHSWQKLKGARIENVIAVLEEEMACLPQLDY